METWMALVVPIIVALIGVSPGLLGELRRWTVRRKPRSRRVHSA